jgi:hypothetical protein
MFFASDEWVKQELLLVERYNPCIWRVALMRRGELRHERREADRSRRSMQG